MKKLIPLLSVCAIFSACHTPTQQTPEGMAIEAVYSVDQKIISTSTTISEVSAKMQSVSLTGCPPEFVDAFRSNIKAWIKFSDVEKKMYTANMTKAQADIRNYLSECQSNPSKAAVELRKQWPSLTKEIDYCTSEIAKTFSEYTLVGAKFDAVYNKGKNLF